MFSDVWLNCAFLASRLPTSGKRCSSSPAASTSAASSSTPCSRPAKNSPGRNPRRRTRSRPGIRWRTLSATPTAEQRSRTAGPSTPPKSPPVSPRADSPCLRTGPSRGRNMPTSNSPSPTRRQSMPTSSSQSTRRSRKWCSSHRRTDTCTAQCKRESTRVQKKGCVLRMGLCKVLLELVICLKYKKTCLKFDV